MLNIVLLASQEGRSRTKLRITARGRIVTASIAIKSLRKAIMTIRTNGIGDCVALIQGKLASGCRCRSRLRADRSGKGAKGGGMNEGADVWHALAANSWVLATLPDASLAGRRPGVSSVNHTWRSLKNPRRWIPTALPNDRVRATADTRELHFD